MQIGHFADFPLISLIKKSDQNKKRYDGLRIKIQHLERRLKQAYEAEFSGLTRIYERQCQGKGRKEKRNIKNKILAHAVFILPFIVETYHATSLFCIRGEAQHVVPLC